MANKTNHEFNNKISAEYSDIVKRAKQQAMNRRAGSPVNVELIPEYIERLSGYIEKVTTENRPPTIAGMALAMGISTDTFYRMKNGELDYVIEEYKICHDLPETATTGVNGEPLIYYSDIVQKGFDILQDRLESNCYQLKGNQVGSIFGLKARFGWQDDTGPGTTNNNLIIADKEKATALLNMLNPSDSNG